MVLKTAFFKKKIMLLQIFQSIPVPNCHRQRCVALVNTELCYESRVAGWLLLAFARKRKNIGEGWTDWLRLLPVSSTMMVVMSYSCGLLALVVTAVAASLAW